jgi:large subunit ribosomal protein L25
MNTTITLNATSREVTGKQVKALRRQGVIPGVVYGPMSENPISVQIEWQKLRPALKEAGGTGLIDLQIDGQAINVLVRSVQRHPVRRDVLHVDFYAVDVTVIIDTTVPIHLIDMDAHAKRLAATIFQSLMTIEVRCLPDGIPSHIDVDLSSLRRAGDVLTVAQLPQLEGVTYLADEEQPILTTVSLAELAEAADESIEMGDVSMEVEVIAKGKEEEEEF